MRIGILGSGGVARTLAEGFVRVGHEVVLGTRDPDATMARTEPDAMGNPPFAAWAADHDDVPLVAFAEAAAQADLVVNATAGHATLAALDAAGAANLDGKVLVDVANVLDFSSGWPPAVGVASDGPSLGEQVQAAVPGARVVKALNTVTAHVMTHPDALGADHTALLCGDDADAKAEVSTLLRSLGWADVLDLGGIVAARGLEHYLAFWVRAMDAIGHPRFNVRVVVGDPPG